MKKWASSKRASTQVRKRHRERKGELVSIFLKPQSAHHSAHFQKKFLMSKWLMSKNLCAVREGFTPSPPPPCMFESARAKPSNWHKCWWKLSKLTRNEVLETMLTGSTSLTHPSPYMVFTQLFSIYLATHCEASQTWIFPLNLPIFH